MERSTWDRETKNIEGPARKENFGGKEDGGGGGGNEREGGGGAMGVRTAVLRREKGRRRASRVTSFELIL